jgi:hypothetical protein
MRPYWHALLLSTTLLSVPDLLSAKSPTARITITSGKLTRPIQITDAKVLRNFAIRFYNLSKITEIRPNASISRMMIPPIGRMARSYHALGSFGPGEIRCE